MGFNDEGGHFYAFNYYLKLSFIFCYYMPYTITTYSKNKAKAENVLIKPSSNKNKKIDVFKNNKKIVSIGDINYSDYPTYLQSNGKAFADERKRLYYKRHQKDSGLAGHYAKKLLW